MNSRHWIIVSFSLIVTAFVIATLLSNREVVAQAPALTEGRYRMEVVHKAEGISTVFLMDVQTGQVWLRSTHHTVNEWTDMGSPTRKAPEREKKQVP